jgi:hypothetical protein
MPCLLENAITRLVAPDGIANRRVLTPTRLLENTTASLDVTDRNPDTEGVISRYPSPVTE